MNMSAPVPRAWRVENTSEGPIQLPAPQPSAKKLATNEGTFFLQSKILATADQPNVREIEHSVWMNMVEKYPTVAHMAADRTLAATPIY